MSEKINPFGLSLQQIWYKARKQGIVPEWEDFKVFEIWANRSGYFKDLNYNLIRLNENKPHGPYNSNWRRQKPK